MLPLLNLCLFFGVFALAYANGSNDISKGIATLVGSGVTNYQRAILWGTAWTTGGSLVSAYFSQGLAEAKAQGKARKSTWEWTTSNWPWAARR